jgi:hypothetical protein
MLSIIASFKSNVITQPLTTNTPLGSKNLHSFLHQLLHLIGETSFQHMSFKLSDLATSSSLTLRNSLLSLYSPPKKCKEPFGRNLIIFVFSRCANISNHTCTNHLLHSKIFDSFISNMLQSSSHFTCWPKATFSYN